jgi:hypothetical protein
VGNTYNKIKALELEVDSLDYQRENKHLSADELIRSNTISSSLRTLYRMQESVWHQKSRVQWCKLGIETLVSFIYQPQQDKKRIRFYSWMLMERF